MKEIKAALEPAALELARCELAFQASIAISLKRIADALEKLDPEKPDYIVECIQGQHERGLRGIPNP